MSLTHFTWLLLPAALLSSCMATSPGGTSSAYYGNSAAYSTAAGDASTPASSTAPASDTGAPTAFSNESLDPASGLEPLPLPAAPRSTPESGTYGGTDGDWEVTLGGSGSNNKNFDAGSFGIAGSVGYYLNDHFELIARQNLNYADFDETEVNGSTRLALDYNFGAGSLRPVLGVNLGYVYGDAVQDSWIAAPEAGLKIYLQKHAFLQVLAEYQFFFNESDDIDDAFGDGQFVYSLLFGLNF